MLITFYLKGVSMKKQVCMLFFVAVFVILMAFSCIAQEQKQTWNTNATAESLGLKPFVVSSEFYPLFPWGNIGESEVLLRSIADCNYNMSGFIGEKSLPIAKKNGLKVILNGIPFNREKLPTMTQEEADVLVAKAVATTKDDPTVLGYYLIDEPGASLFPGLGKLVKAIEKNAPGKLAYINLFPSYATTIGSDRQSQLETHTFTEYLERYVQEVKPQYISYDNYMVEYSEDMSHEERAEIYWRDLIEVRRIAMKYKLPWWNIISCLCIQKEASPPTPARFAFQSYTSLAAGANGLSWFIYTPHDWSYAPLDEQGRKTLTWSYMREINEQIRAIGKVLNSYESTDIWFSEPKPFAKLPKNPKKLLNKVTLSWSKMGGKMTEIPSVMVGEFKSKDGTHDAVMVVNLNFGRSVKVDFDFVKKYERIEGVSANDGHIIEKVPVNGWWILPGHGSLFLLK